MIVLVAESSSGSRQLVVKVIAMAIAIIRQ